MATLRSKNISAALVLRPYTTFHLQVEFVKDGVQLLSTTVTVTKDDLQRLRQGLRDVATERCSETSVEILDGDLVIEAERVTDADIVMRMWQGEPYLFMKGYRFLVSNADLQHFVVDLEIEETRSLPPAQLP